MNVRLPTSSDDKPVPQQLPARELKLIAAIDRYAKYTTDPSDPELSGMLFIKAQTYARFDQTEIARYWEERSGVSLT